MTPSFTILKAAVCALLLTTASATASRAQSPSGGGPGGDSTVIVPGVRTFLEPNAPNPFAVTTRIAYSIQKDSHVLLTVHDFFYDRMITLVDADQTAGRHVIDFIPPGTVATGMYIYTLQTDAGVEQRRMLYSK